MQTIQILAIIGTILMFINWGLQSWIYHTIYKNKLPLHKLDERIDIHSFPFGNQFLSLFGAWAIVTLFCLIPIINVLLFIAMTAGVVEKIVLISGLKKEYNV